MTDGFRGQSDDIGTAFKYHSIVLSPLLLVQVLVQQYVAFLNRSAEALSWRIRSLTATGQGWARSRFSISIKMQDGAGKAYVEMPVSGSRLLLRYCLNKGRFFFHCPTHLMIGSSCSSHLPVTCCAPKDLFSADTLY